MATSNQQQATHSWSANHAVHYSVCSHTASTAQGHCMGSTFTMAAAARFVRFALDALGSSHCSVGRPQSISVAKTGSDFFCCWFQVWRTLVHVSRGKVRPNLATSSRAYRSAAMCLQDVSNAFPAGQGNSRTLTNKTVWGMSSHAQQ